VSKSTATKLSGSLLPPEEIQRGAHPRRNRYRAPSSGNAGDLSSLWGQQVPFNQLLAAGALKKAADGTYKEANGFTAAWDDCSDTPYLFNVAKQTVVTYDDTYSLGDKAIFAKQSGMAGCFTWSLDQDDGLSLQNAIRAALGK